MSSISVVLLPFRITYELMTQDPEYGLCGHGIDPHRCLRMSSEIHAAGECEVRVFVGVSMGTKYFGRMSSCYVFGLDRTSPWWQAQRTLKDRNTTQIE